MKKIIVFFVAVIAAGCVFGCKSEYEKTMERQEKMSGDWEKDINKWKSTQEKPTKPLWERYHEEDKR